MRPVEAVGVSHTQSTILEEVPRVFTFSSGIITSFAVELNQDVDYLQVEGLGEKGTYVPTRSNIQVTVQPIYSRRAVESFSLDKFVNGGYIGNSGGFI